MEDTGDAMADLSERSERESGLWLVRPFQALLEAHGVVPPPPPQESLSKPELPGSCVSCWQPGTDKGPQFQRPDSMGLGDPSASPLTDALVRKAARSMPSITTNLASWCSGCAGKDELEKDRRLIRVTSCRAQH